VRSINTVGFASLFFIAIPVISSRHHLTAKQLTST
jgi:hypothetical protein